MTSTQTSTWNLASLNVAKIQALHLQKYLYSTVAKTLSHQAREKRREGGLALVLIQISVFFCLTDVT